MLTREADDHLQLLLGLVETCALQHVRAGEPLSAAAAYGELAKTGLHLTCLGEASGGLQQESSHPYWVCETLGRLLPARLERHGFAELAVQSAALIAGSQEGSAALPAEAFSSGAIVVPACAGVNANDSFGSAHLWMDAGQWHVAGHKRVSEAATHAGVFLISATLASSGTPLLAAIQADSAAAQLQLHQWPQRDACAELCLSGPLATMVVLCEGRTATFAVERSRQARSLGECALITGRLQSMIDDTATYVHRRRQFGEPLAVRQVVQHRLADAWQGMHQLRSLLRWMLGRLDSATDEERQLLSLALQSQAAQVAPEVGETCIQLHGAMGVTEECPVARRHRSNFAAMCELSPQSCLQEDLASVLLAPGTCDPSAPFLGQAFLDEMQRA